jgi:hypothetical protein
MRMLRLGIFSLAVLLVGCYTLEPTGGAAPEPGTRVALEINDAGRLALGGFVGPGVTQIEGRLIGRENDAYLVAVSAVTTLRGGTQVWAGERISVLPGHVGTIYERRLSAGRSVTLGVVAIGGFTAFILSRDLLGLGRESTPGGGPKDTTGASIIRP